MTLEERVELLEFQMSLLFENSDISRFVYELGITQEQYTQVMDVMDEIRSRIEGGESVSNYDFEEKLYSILPDHRGDYHTCELFAKLFMEDGRWAEVFPHLYGHMPKYQ